MKKFHYVLTAAITIAILFTVTAITTVNPIKTLPASAATGCPANTSEGVYFERGRDEQGNALCGFSFYHPCPYTEAVSADDPMCYKGQPVQQSEPARAPEATPADPVNTNTCGVTK